ncbi:MAG: hypothetical protein PUG33_02115 [Mollicutes bacterium]|nr:hypothetical protein [Mollicutes bacterium]
MKKELKKDLRFIIIFILVVTISFIYLFQSTYAKYKKQVNSNVNSTIASWNIKINNETINNKKTLTNSITPTFYENEYVKENTLAPGIKGYFDINIDSSKVDVDFNYEVNAVLNNSTNLTDFKITDYELNDSGTKQNFNTTGISNSLPKNTKNTKIRFYVEWIDDDTNVMNNIEDTTYATNHDDVKYVLTIKFTQKKESN